MLMVNSYFSRVRVGMKSSASNTYIMEVAVKDLSVPSTTITNDIRLSVSLQHFPVVHIEPKGIEFRGSGKRMEFRMSKEGLQQEGFRVLLCRYIPELDDHLVIGTSDSISLRDILLNQTHILRDTHVPEFAVYSMDFRDGIGNATLVVRVFLKEPSLSRTMPRLMSNQQRLQRVPIAARSPHIDTPNPEPPIPPEKQLKMNRTKFDYGNFQQRA